VTTYTYIDVLRSKLQKPLPCGQPCQPDDLPAALQGKFRHQALVTAWAIRQGRAALFLDTGLGKTPCQVAWANYGCDRALIVAPLCVAQQTIAQAADLLDVEVVYRREPHDGRGIQITNYEHAHKFIGAGFGKVALDESSILKAVDGKTRKLLTEGFADVPGRLACTATPAPNDVSELVNHADFLGVMRGPEVLATFFVNESGQGSWRLKGHAHAAFYEWLASWAIAIRSPADLGLDGKAYDLPPLEIEDAVVPWEYVRAGELFGDKLHGIQDRARARRDTGPARIAVAAGIVQANPGPWVVWCGLNSESEGITAALVDDSVAEVTGSMSADAKEAAIGSFLAGRVRVLVTKPDICGMGMNFQHCAQTLFLGLSDSYESYYQAIRRFWRFGQRKPVRAVIVTTSAEQEIVVNVRRKEAEAAAITAELVARCQRHIIENVHGRDRSVMADYSERQQQGEGWTLINGDCVEAGKAIPDESVDLSVFSPPFVSLYTYTDDPRDMGNSPSADTFFAQFGFLIRELHRITKRGRMAAVHVAQVPAMLSRDGFIGLKDFRGQTIEAFIGAGWHYFGEAAIDKDPQAQAIRTKSKCLLFAQGQRDSSWLRPALADFVLFFRKPGEPEVPIRALRGEKNPGGWITADQWIEWARPIWWGIKESDTLNVREARSDDDERHICPLQLETIHRAVMLWSAPGELVFSPFAGIGSEGVQAIEDGRRFLGVELKPEYFAVACKNLARAVREAASANRSLFADPDDAPAAAAQPPKRKRRVAAEDGAA